MASQRQPTPDELVRTHLRLAERIAAERMRSLYGAFSYVEDDIRSAAFYGLVQASRSYLPGAGTFAQWAARRINGAIQDAQRQEDFLGRLARKKWRDEGRTDAPLVRGDIGRVEIGRQAALPTQDHAVERRMLRERLSLAASHALNDQQRRVLSLLYVDGLKQVEIARVIGRSEMRVCQIVGEALRKMREWLAA